MPGEPEALNQDFLAAQLTAAFGSAPPATPDPAARAETNMRSERLAQLDGELARVLLPTERRAALEQERYELLKADHAALASHAPEPGPSPDTLTWAVGTEAPVQRAFAALAVEYDVPRSEAQAVLGRLERARWLPAEQFHAAMQREWGAAYRDNLARVQRELDTLHGPLKELIYARMADDTLFSPDLARELLTLPARRARVRRG